MNHRSLRHSILGLLFIYTGACEPINSGEKAWGDDGRGKGAAPALSTEEAEAKRAGEAFIKALKDKKPKDLLATSVVVAAFRLFLPEAFDGAGKEETIANAAAQSEDKRLRRLAEASFVTAMSGESPGKLLAIFVEPPPIPEQPGTLQTLEVEMIGGSYRVVQIGSNAFGDGGGKWLVNQCSAFSAPFKVPAKLSPKPTFESCAESLKTLKQQLTAKAPDALSSLASFIDGQPFVEHRKKLVVGSAKHTYNTGEDKSAFAFGLAEGDKLRYQFLLSMGSYCGCLPSEKTTK